MVAREQKLGVLIECEYAIIARINDASDCDARYAFCVASASTMDVDNAQFLLSGNMWMTYFTGIDNNEKKIRGKQSALLKMRGIRGEFHNQYFDLRRDESAFYDYMSMSQESFDYICNIIKDDCSHMVTNYKIPISVEERLVLTIRYLTTGTSFRKLSIPFRISKTAIASIVLEVCSAVWKKIHHKHMKFPSIEKFN